jgi:prophage regulatory protein
MVFDDRQHTSTAGRSSSIFDGVAPDLDVVGLSEIAEFLELTRQRVDQLARTDPDFPEPAAIISAGRIWRRADVEKWATKTGRIA